MLITTTNPAWERMHGVKPCRLPTVSDDELDHEIQGELTDLIGGRLLLLYAFKDLMKASGLDAARIAAHKPAELSSRDERAGPATFWANARELRGFDEYLLLARHCAYLPADSQPVEKLTRIAPAAEAIVEKLAAIGLLRREETSPLVSMHRLFGAAVRSDLEASEPEACDQIVLHLASDPQMQEIYDMYGDLESIERLSERLRRIDATRGEIDHELGVAMYSVAELCELHGHTWPSAELYAHAESHLHADKSRLADCMLGQARAVNQHPDRNARDIDDPGERRAIMERDLRQARERAKLAASIGEERQVGKAMAMQGLLMQKLADYPRTHETKLELLRAALAVLIEADDRRTQPVNGIEISATELARSRFNLAGIRVALAKEDSRNADKLLGEAQAIYEEVLRIRTRLYERGSHPHIAACVIGLGYVGYYRAVLIPALPWQRSGWLREATEHAVEALGMRASLDGELDLAESGKVARFLAKVAMARHAVPPRSKALLDGLSKETVGELERSPVQPLPSDGRGLESAVSAWARSPHLHGLVREFDGDPPGAAMSLADLLAWLDEFSTRWDFRGGVERNLVTAPVLGEQQGDLVVEAAHRLGLIGTSRPPYDRYDHMLILGGLVRACFARPLHAARLLAEKDARTNEPLKVGRVTALGGHRPLGGDELDLVARIEEGELSDELEAMDSGVRRAFCLGEPSEVRGVPSTVVGESWTVHEYRTGAVPVSVIAAPSTEPGVRRANTADTYEWFASEYAQLRPGERVLVVTSDIYAPYQHADALRMLAVKHEVEVDVVGIQPGDLDARLMQTFEPHNYLQEIRSTIRALRALYQADLAR